MVHDVAALAAEVVESGHDLVNEEREGGGQMAAGIALEDLPLALLGIELGTVGSEPKDMEPGRACLESGTRDLTPVARTIVEHEVDFFARGGVAGIKRLEIEHKTYRSRKS